MRDEYGNELVRGDEIEVRDYVPSLNDWIYTTGIYYQVGDTHYLITTDNTRRDLYPYDYVKIIKAHLEHKRNLYGYRKRV